MRYLPLLFMYNIIQAIDKYLHHTKNGVDTYLLVKLLQEITYLGKHILLAFYPCCYLPRYRYFKQHVFNMA